MEKDTRVFCITVRHMPFNDKWVVPVRAQTLEEAKEKAVEWTQARPPGAYEYYKIDG